MKASTERKAAAETLQIQMKAQQDAVLLAAKVEADKAERERKWAKEDRDAIAAKAASDLAHVAKRVERAEKTADMAFAASNLGTGLVEDRPVPPPTPPGASRRIAALRAAEQERRNGLDRRHSVTDLAMSNLRVTELFTPGHEPDDFDDMPGSDAVERVEEAITVKPLEIKPYREPQ
jgi:hypothetical protein